MVYGDVEFPSVDYFCTTIRNDFLNEIKVRDNAMKHILNNAVDYFVDKNQYSYVKRSLDRKNICKNKKIIDYFFERIRGLAIEFHQQKLSPEQRVERMKIFCDDLVRNKKILRDFTFFNDSFIDMMLRFSKDKLWGVELSFSYFSKYFSSD